MPVSRYAYSKVKRQEQFGYGYVRSIVSAAGYKFSVVNDIDEDSVDFQISQKANSVEYPRIQNLMVQMKCTYDKKPSRDGFLHYPLSAKNYDDLRANRGEPFILVVLCIPTEDEAEWLVESDNSMALHNVAYWMSLRGYPTLPESTTDYNNRTTTVQIPEKQRFNVNGLIEIMDTLAAGGFPK